MLLFCQCKRKIYLAFKLPKTAKYTLKFFTNRKTDKTEFTYFNCENAKKAADKSTRKAA